MDFEKQEAKTKDIYALTDKTRSFLSELENLSKKPLRAGGAYGFSSGLTHKNFSFGLSQRKYLVIGSQLKLSPKDVSQITKMLNTFDAIAGVLDSGDDINTLISKTDYADIQELIEVSVKDEEINQQLYQYQEVPKVNLAIKAMENLEFDLDKLNQYVDIEGFFSAIISQKSAANSSGLEYPDIDIRDYFRYQIPEEFLSTVDFSGAEISESIISIASLLNNNPKLSLGINFKYQDIETIGFKQTLTEIDFSAYKQQQYRINHQKFNLDIGSSYLISKKWRAGLMIKNIIKYSLKVNDGKPILIEPIARIALAYNNHAITWAIDADLTKNEPLGFDQDKQYLSSGLEWRANKKLALRTGYRLNLTTNDAMPSIGFGLAFKRASIDAALASKDFKTELGTSLQFNYKY